MSRLPSFEEALSLVLAHAVVLPAEDVALAEAAGRVLAEAVHARVDLPPFDSSAMDGYAVRSADTPGELPVGGQSAAGAPLGRALRPGEAVQISTGAVVPAGADAVVPVERTDVTGDRIRVERVESSAHVRPRGGDIRLGAVVGREGARLGPAQLGALAAVGVASVSCTRRPVVSVVPTGTELQRPGETLGEGQIYESNTTLIAAQVASAGGVPRVLEAVGDDPAATTAALERALEADVVVTSGGVSVGPHDLVRAALVGLDAEEVFWRVAIKPGKPVAFAVRDATLVFGLPGNPVSSLVAFELFVRPALLRLQGVVDAHPRFAPGVLGARVARGEGRDELLRARITITDDGVVLDPLAGQESHMIAAAFEADALVLVPRGEGTLDAGARVSYLRL